MKTEILPYQRLGDMARDYEKAKANGLSILVSLQGNIILAPMAFLLGRVSVNGGLMPFGLALYASTLGTNVSRVLIALFMLAGMISNGAREQVYLTIASMLLFNAINIPFKKNKPKLNLRYATMGSISMLIPQLVIVYLQGFLMYDLFKALFAGFLVFSLIYIFRNAVVLITNTKKKHIYTNEEIISISIIAALAIAGFGDFQIFGFGFRNVVSIFFMLIFSYKCGPGVGAAIGVTVGIIMSLAAPGTPLIIGSYAFCGLLAGVFKNMGKIGASLGFAAGNAVLTFYLNGSTEVLIYLKDIVVAMAVFLVVPNKFIDVLTNAFTRNIDTCPDKRSYSERVKEITVDKLNRFSRAFEELSKTFSEISETKVVTDKQDITTLFDRVADKVCRDCSLCLHCWDRNFYNTYQVMFKVVEKLDSRGYIDQSDIPAYFLERCERISDFVNAVNNVYELFKVDMVWKSKIGESRGLVSQQLDGLSKVISNLASEIDLNVQFKSDLEDMVLMELNKAGIKVNEVIVFENKWGKYEVSIFHKGCGGVRSCVNNIEKAVSELVGRKVVKESSDCCKNAKGTSCALKLVEEEAYRITTGVARLTKQGMNVSGDSYTFMSSGDGKYIAALSDGMGSGQRAATQSRAAINLLEQFLETGFDKDTTIKLINSILVLKSSDDCFSTIDLSVIDLYEGEVEFVKVGAAPTFIKKAEKVETVKTISLPAGILSSIETELVKKKVDNGDYIIMVTDGILDSFRDKGENDENLIQFIHGIQSKNPQEIAELITDKAYENCDGEPVDDMTVLVGKIWKRVE